MARLSKTVFVAVLVAMLAAAPMLEAARPLTEDTAVAVAHKRKLHTFFFVYPIVKAKLCLVKTVLSLGHYECYTPYHPAPTPYPTPTYPTPTPTYPTPTPTYPTPTPTYPTPTPSYPTPVPKPYGH